MPTIFIKTEHDLLSYDLAPGADIQALLPLLAEDLGEPEENIQLFLHGNRLYPGTALIRDQTYEVSIHPIERILLRARVCGGDWIVEQIRLDTDERLPSLTRCGSRRHQVRHRDDLLYYWDARSFASVMPQAPTCEEEVEQFVMDQIEFLPGDHVMIA